MDNEMSRDWQDDELAVVINHEEQFSYWPAHRTPPDGWQAVGFTGSKRACGDFVADVWKDMRPFSLRQQMDGSAVKSAWDDIRATLDSHKQP
jgi:MbtH protein